MIIFKILFLYKQIKMIQNYKKKTQMRFLNTKTNTRKKNNYAYPYS